MTVSFDPAKRIATLELRGVDMARVEEVFEGPFETVVDDRKDYGETRFVTVGYLDGRMIVTVWTFRDSVRRIISLRKANDREQAEFGFRLHRP